MKLPLLVLLVLSALVARGADASSAPPASEAKTARGPVVDAATAAEAAAAANPPAPAPAEATATPAQASAASAPAAVPEKAAPAPASPAVVATPHFSSAPILPPSRTAVHTPATPEEIASLLRLGQSTLERSDFISAELAFRRVLQERATRDQDRDALIGLARVYRRQGDFIKAAAIYEKVIAEYAGDPALPLVYLELGRTHRALGAYKQAISRFYNVINSTLKLPEQGPDLYRQLARTAQFELAETHLQMGNFERANVFFSRLTLLDLASEDRARAHFKAAYALHQGGMHDKAISGLRGYLEQNPNDENVPEARYLLSLSLRRVGRASESLSTALELLRTEQTRVTTDPKRWVYWQRRTGNQLANDFYESGDVTSALQIYQTLVNLSPEPAWRLPATYQLGLCHERLRLFDQARQCYQTIVDNLAASKTDGSTRPELADLADMAAWRLNHISWQENNEKKLSAIFPATSAPVPALALSSPPVDSSHDVHRSAEKSPDAVR